MVMLIVDDVIEVMKDVIDFEFMVNVVDFGFVYGVNIDGEGNVIIDMMLMSFMCLLIDCLEYDIQIVLEGIVKFVMINWVWLLLWGLECIIDDGWVQFQVIGFNV